MSTRRSPIKVLIVDDHALIRAGSALENHVTSLFADIGARDRAQAVILAYETGLVRPGE
ncbi:hypothetical protein ITP53_36075 [Nonomuraea sp. K274]|uniref:DNA-binding response regulator n=1 Tax=Nonomuraea cypriaca TaxID=1187855 RepID=A0A931AE19_9ACTN|nr:hypothetical protein [Nonomuraea cypriaca]MBF8191036.1 hypothetical protein [Nonomuraea cypriaca]